MTTLHKKMVSTFGLLLWLVSCSTTTLTAALKVEAIVHSREFSLPTLSKPGCPVGEASNVSYRMPKFIRDEIDVAPARCYPDAEPIPVLGVSVVHDAKNFLTRLVASIDFPVKHLVIAYNGLDRHVAKQARLLSRDFANITLLRFPRPQGCAEGWNAAIEAFPDEAWYLLPNSDVFFPPGQLQKLSAAFYNDPAEECMLNILNGNYCAYTAFAVKQSLIRRIGKFDGSIYPAYMEDVEWGIRRQNADPPVDVVCYRNIVAVHGLVEDADYVTGETRRFEHTTEQQQRAHAVGAAGQLNRDYVTKKWGCTPGFRVDIQVWDIASCNYKTPFNSSNLTIADWKREEQDMMARMGPLLQHTHPDLYPLLPYIWNTTWEKQ